MILDNGYLKDFDQPFKLLVDNETDTKITRKKNIFAGLVKNTGKEAARMIMMKARETFFANKMQNDLEKDRNHGDTILAEKKQEHEGEEE